MRRRVGKKKKAQRKIKRGASLSQSYELAALSCGFERVAGVDEAGRGPLAGPVVAAAVVLSPECGGLDINDSKKLTPKRRERLYGEIVARAAATKIVSVGVVDVDRMNIYRAAMYAMREAVMGLEPPPGFVYVDGNRRIGVDVAQMALKKGDACCCSIAAASILAKVSRDRQMIEYEELYPGYGFARHKGYGTREHVEALRRLGPSPIHRRSFAPVKELMRP